ncbi:MAG: DUF370 domain-containing protein [Oscillospiraceae bacterium]|jgi:regulator of extracellular matrix RemA (YlzA/DUF370 family)|nr:DUF370 domain-containing protein [Oscillospiraceae bacterium]
MKMVNIGFGNMLSVPRILTLLRADSQPVKRMVQEAKTARTLIDCTQGRRTRAVLVLDSGHTVLSYLQPETIVHRLQNDNTQEETDEDE